jgi:hypothetical protein
MSTVEDEVRADALLALHARLEAVTAERDELAANIARVDALHNGVHWCHDAEQQPAVFEPGSTYWPCPTRAALRGNP